MCHVWFLLTLLPITGLDDHDGQGVGLRGSEALWSMACTYGVNGIFSVRRRRELESFSSHNVWSLLGSRRSIEDHE
jgi:hypothetical protein